MKRHKNDPLLKAIKNLLDQGKIVIGKIRVNDGDSIANYSTLSACPPEHREGFRRALETGGDVYVQDVVYEPVFFAKDSTTGVATLE